MLSPKSVLRLLFLVAFLLSAATADTQITFPSFSPKSNGDIFTFGDAAYDLADLSYIINPGARTSASRGSCGAMVYRKPVRIQQNIAATGSVASFSTSFSFAFTTHGVPWDNRSNPLDGSGFGFTLVENMDLITMHDVVSIAGKFGACKSSSSFGFETNPSRPPNFIGVHFGTDYSPNHNKPSNNFIRVARNHIPFEYDHIDHVEAYMHNLCGNDTTHCKYFSDGRTFTAWIDFSSSSEQTLEVRMANGSTPKPLQPLLRISHYQFPKSIGGEVLVAFWGSSDVNHMEEHELLSWSFFSTEISSESRTGGVGKAAAGVLVGTLMVALVILVKLKRLMNWDQPRMNESWMKKLFGCMFQGRTSTPSLARETCLVGVRHKFEEMSRGIGLPPIVE